MLAYMAGCKDLQPREKQRMNIAQRNPRNKIQTNILGNGYGKCEARQILEKTASMQRYCEDNDKQTLQKKRKYH